MVVLSLDLSEVSTGWCLLCDGKIVSHGTLVLHKQDFYEMYILVRDKICALNEVYKLDLIVLEDCYQGRNHKTFKELSRLQGAVMGVAYNLLVNLATIYPTSWRAQLGLNKKNAKRTELKDMTFDYVTLELDEMVKTQDEADAICIGLGYIKKHELV